MSEPIPDTPPAAAAAEAVEAAELRKRIAELEAERYRDGQLIEQRHQVLDPVAPAPSAYNAVGVTL